MGTAPGAQSVRTQFQVKMRKSSTNQGVGIEQTEDPQEPKGQATSSPGPGKVLYRGIQQGRGGQRTGLQSMGQEQSAVPHKRHGPPRKCGHGDSRSFRELNIYIGIHSMARGCGSNPRGSGLVG